MTKAVTTYSNLLLIIFVCLALLLTAFGKMPALVLFFILAFTAALIIYCHLLTNKNSILLFITWWLLVFLGLAIGLYRPEGFHYPLLFSASSLHEGGSPFSLYVNTSKAIAGYLVLTLLLPLAFNGKRFVNNRLLQRTLAILFALAVIVSAYIILDLNIHLKPINYILLFAAANLFATCISEEAFMRLVFHNEIIRLLSKYSKSTLLCELIPLVLTTALFVVTHLSSSFIITVVFAIAGFLYGLIYTLTKNIVLAIAVHFFVNILHFSFMTYPVG